jgi:hypothetical protein
MRKLATLLFGLLIGVSAGAATFSLFQPASGILVGSPSTYVTSAATSSNVRSLWSGTCDITTFLRGDGACTNIISGNAPTFSVYDSTAVANRLAIAADGSVTIGSPTGGDMGPGTINATALYINGDAVGTSSGAVSSVALTMPSVFTVTGSPVTSAGTLTAAFATGQTQNQVLATPNGSSGAVGLRSLVAADIPALGANPSASIGLTANNGAATTYMRSDATPALSQAIVPTWTGQHTFSTVGSAPVIMNSSAANGPYFTMQRSGTPFADIGNAPQIVSGATLDGLALGTRSTSTPVVLSSGSVRSHLTVLPTGLSFGNVTDNPAYSFLGSGAASWGGPSTFSPSGGVATTANGAANQWTSRALGSVTTGQSYGLDVNAGTNSSDVALRVMDQSASTSYFTVRGDGAVTVGGTLGLFIPGGTAGNPGLRFSSDTDTGIWSGGDNVLRFGTAGTPRMELNNASGMVMQSGNQILLEATLAASTPSLAFSGDADTGIYSGGSNNLSIAVNSTQSFSVNSSAGVQSFLTHGFTDGSAASPALIFNNDDNTGFYRPNTDQVGLAAGGAAIAIAYSGGLSMQQGVLLTTDGTAGAPSFTFGSDPDTGIYRGSSNALSFATGGLEGMSLSGTGLAVGATDITVGGVSVCLEDGTNCPTSSGSVVVVRKTGATTRSSTITTSADPTLTTGTMPLGYYRVNLMLYSGNAGLGGFRYGFSCTGGAIEGSSFRNTIVSRENGGTMTSSNNVSVTSGDTLLSAANYFTGGQTTILLIDALVDCRTTGTGGISFDWAQETSNGTGFQLNEGSTMTVSLISN